VWHPQGRPLGYGRCIIITHHGPGRLARPRYPTLSRACPARPARSPPFRLFAVEPVAVIIDSPCSVDKLSSSGWAAVVSYIIDLPPSSPSVRTAPPHADTGTKHVQSRPRFALRPFDQSASLLAQLLCRRNLNQWDRLTCLFSSPREPIHLSTYSASLSPHRLSARTCRKALSAGGKVYRDQCG
jgi:hypothetical protein